MAYRWVLIRTWALFRARMLPRSWWSPPSTGVLQAIPNNFGTPALNLFRLMGSKSRMMKTTFTVRNVLDFQERVLNSNIPVVVEFHAQWCGPCKILGPRLEKAVAKHQGKVLMAKVDIYDNIDLATFFEVSAMPTVLAIKNGIVVDKFVGLKNEQQLEVFLNKLIYS